MYNELINSTYFAFNITSSAPPAAAECFNCTGYLWEISIIRMCSILFSLDALVLGDFETKFSHEHKSNRADVPIYLHLLSSDSLLVCKLTQVHSIDME